MFSQTTGCSIHFTASSPCPLVRPSVSPQTQRDSERAGTGGHQQTRLACVACACKTSTTLGLEPFLSGIPNIQNKGPRSSPLLPFSGRENLAVWTLRCYQVSRRLLLLLLGSIEAEMSCASSKCILIVPAWFHSSEKDVDSRLPLQRVPKRCLL